MHIAWATTQQLIRHRAGHDGNMEAAQVFTTVLTDDGEDAPISLTRGSHAVTRGLWQQRFFEQAIGARCNLRTIQPR